MAELTQTTAFTIGDGVVQTVSTIVNVVLPSSGTNVGKGRLVHPVYGTYDYEFAPDKYTNIFGSDVVIPPGWTSTKTLSGSANTLFVGNIRDVMVKETWDQDIAMLTSQLQVLLTFWMNPPDPSVDYVRWYPTYTTQLGFKVIMLNLTCGGDGITTNYLTKQEVVEGPVVLEMKIAGRV